MADQRCDDSNDHRSGEAMDAASSYTSTTATIRPAGAPPRSALAGRRQSATALALLGNGSGNAPLRPTPVAPRSGLISPTRSSRPQSPPNRYPSPPMRAQSTMTGRSNPAGPHAQQEQEAPKPEDLAKFAELCRQLYYDKEAGAAQSVDSILNRLPLSARPIYARTMAGVRSQFHRDEELRRRRQAESALAATEPGRIVREALRVAEGGTIAMRSARAKQERARRLKVFIAEHCQKAMPGVHPFFRSLYLCLYLQSLKAEKGGAGKRRVEWEVDMAVFSEASGGTWLLDSIELLKGVLGCSEQIKETAPDSYFDEDDEDGDDGFVAVPPSPILNEPASTGAEASSSVVEGVDDPKAKKTPPAVPPHRSIGRKSLRERSSSDPFLDPSDRRTPVARGPLTDPPSPVLASSPSATTPFFDSSSAASLGAESAPARPTPSPRRLSQAASSPAPPPPQFRIFTLPPYLTDPELTALSRLFPDFIRTRATPAALASTAATKLDEEAAVGPTARLGLDPEQMEEGGFGKVGHGEVRIGVTSRDAGWTGTLWERFFCWLSGLFGA